MATHETLIALCFSFTDSTDIPYQIHRIGQTKAEGGRGVVWTCNCPQSSLRGVNCKHLKTLWREARYRVIERDTRYQLTEYGRAVMKLAPAPSSAPSTRAPTSQPGIMRPRPLSKAAERKLAAVRARLARKGAA